MPAFILPLLGFAKANWKLIATGLAALLISLLVWSWESRGRTIDALNAEIAKYEMTLQQVRDANQQLTSRLAERQVEVTRQIDLLGRVRNAPASEDGPIAPVLRDALNGLRQNRQSQP